MGKRDFSSRDREPLSVCSLFLPGCVYLISLNPVHSGGGGILSSQAPCRVFTDSVSADGFAGNLKHWGYSVLGGGGLSRVVVVMITWTYACVKIHEMHSPPQSISLHGDLKKKKAQLYQHLTFLSYTMWIELKLTQKLKSKTARA